MNATVRSSRGATAFAMILLLAALFVLTACPPTPSIAEINRNPGKYAGREVGVQGNVEQTAGLLGTGAYRINDGTGSIWVMSQGYGVPGRGAHVKVVGTLVQGASLGGTNFGFAIRQTQKTR